MTSRHLLAVLLIVGLAGCDTGTVATTTTDAVESATTAALEPTTPDSCEPFPITEAESLIRNADTGARRVGAEGPILATAAIRDPHQTPQGSDLWVIAINVDGVVILLAHNVPAGDRPDGPGFWAALDKTSSHSTGFPTNSDSPNPWPITSEQAAWDCVDNP